MAHVDDDVVTGGSRQMAVFFNWPGQCNLTTQLRNSYYNNNLRPQNMCNDSASSAKFIGLRPPSERSLIKYNTIVVIK